MKTEIIELVITGDELQLMVSGLIQVQESLLKQRLEDSGAGDNALGNLIERYSYLINKLENKTKKEQYKPNEKPEDPARKEKIITTPPPVKKYHARGLADIRLLLVDDNPDFTKPMADLLKEMGIGKVDHTHNGALAMTMIRKSGLPYNLVICDWNMPKKDGLEVLAEIRHDPGLHDLPFILISGVKGGNKVRKALNLGVNDYLVKPISPEEILSKIKSIFDISEAIA